MSKRRAKVLALLALAASGCGGDPGGIEVPAGVPVPGARTDIPADTAGATGARALEPLVTTALTTFTLHTELSLGGRGSEVLCPDPQPLLIGGTYLSKVTKDADGTSEIATLCALDVPGFIVSAHGALGGCDETRTATLQADFDVAEVAQKSFLEVPLANLDAMPVAFVLGAALDDPFSDVLPDWSTPDQWRDDDADGAPGITLTATGIPLLPEGASLYTSARLLVTPTTTSHATASLELTLLGSDAGLSGRTLQVISPDLRAGLVMTYVREEVPEGTTCADTGR